MRFLAITTVFAVLAVPLPAQPIHVVGPGGLPQIRDALAIAAPGDVVHVQPGTYAQFRCDLGVTIRALVPGSVTVAIDPAFIGPCAACWSEGITELAPPPGQTVHLIGLAFSAAWVVFQGQFVYPSVQVTSGRATFENCAIEATSAVFAGLHVQQASVHLQSCTIDATEILTGITGLRAIDASVTAVDNGITTHASLSSALGSAVWLTGSTLHGSGLVLTSFTPSTLRADDSPVWLSDSTLVNNGSLCPVGFTGVTPQLDRCTLLPAAANCPPFLPAASLLGVSRPAPLQSGQPFTLVFQTVPNGFVAVWASTAFGGGAVPGVLAQPVATEPTMAIDAGIVFAGAGGNAIATRTLPAGPALVDVPIWFQGVTGFSLPLQVSPPAGGTVR
jgi:hypothetical protein